MQQTDSLPIPGPSIIFVDNDSNWKDAPVTNPATNRPNLFTYSQLKLQCSYDTNEQLADILSYIANTLTANQTPSPNSNSRETKACISSTFSSTEPNKLNNFLFQCCLYFHTNLAQSDMNIAKINIAMAYLAGVV